MKYPLTFYTDKGVGDGHAASTRLCVILIRPRYRDDIGLYEHELTHVKQWAAITLISALVIAAVSLPAVGMALGVHGLLYDAAPWYRLRCEVQAYHKQLGYYPDDRAQKFAGYIAGWYNLDVTPTQVLELLRK